MGEDNKPESKPEGGFDIVALSKAVAQELRKLSETKDKEGKEPESVKTWNCPECGTPVKEGVKYCPGCGVELIWEE